MTPGTVQEAPHAEAEADTAPGRIIPHERIRGCSEPQSGWDGPRLRPVMPRTNVWTGDMPDMRSETSLTVMRWNRVSGRPSVGSTDSATKACQAQASDAAWRSSPIAPQGCAAGAGLDGHDVGRSTLRQACRFRNKTVRDVSGLYNEPGHDEQRHLTSPLQPGRRRNLHAVCCGLSIWSKAKAFRTRRPFPRRWIVERAIDRHKRCHRPARNWQCLSAAWECGSRPFRRAPRLSLENCST